MNNGVLYIVEGEMGISDYVLINLKTKKREYLNCDFIDNNSLLVAHEYNLQTRKRLKRLLKKMGI